MNGRTEKLLIARDESYKVYLEGMIDTRGLMQEFTDSMVQDIDESALQTSETLKILEGYVMPEGRPYVDDSLHSMKKLRYHIRDYRDIYDISENDFASSGTKRVNVPTAIREI